MSECPKCHQQPVTPTVTGNQASNVPMIVAMADEPDGVVTSYKCRKCGHRWSAK